MSIRIGIGIALLGGAAQVWAGGPLATHNGRSVAWKAGAVIEYRIDDGPMSSMAAAQTVIADAFAEWSKVATARIAFKPLPMGRNVRSAAEFNAILVAADPRSTVLLDEDGSVFRSRYGKRGDHVLALTFPRRVGNDLVRFDLMLNGARLKTKPELFHTTVHEAGHAIGLDHTQLNSSAANNGNAIDDDFLPVLFPYASRDRAPSGALTADDAAAVSALYQGAGFATAYGRITGALKNASGPVRGANVVAIRLTPDPNGTTPNRARVFSCVSDYLKQQTGTFDLYLPPGRYRLHVEPVRFEFVEGSSVGPYAAHVGDLSFVNRIAPQTLSAVHTVAAGQIVTLGDIHVK